MRRFQLLVAAIVLVDSVFFAVLSPLLPDYAARLDLSKTATGLLAGAFAAGVLVAALPSGLLASRVGLRTSLLLGLGLTAATSILFGLADRWSLLVATRFAAGVVVRAPKLAILKDGDVVRAHAGDVPARFLLVSAQPLHEPYARWGPFVMNTQEEIAHALRELRDGTFIKKA